MQQRRLRPLLLKLGLLICLLAGMFVPSAMASGKADTSTTEPAGSNIAVGHIASADSAQSSQPASNANDGDGTTYWCAADGNTGHFWTVDLGTYNNLTGVGVDFGATAAFQYRIQISRDGTNWDSAADQSANTSTQPYQYSTFEARNVRYVRIVFTGLPTGYWACMAEFQVYALSQGVNVASGKTVTADSTLSGFPASNVLDSTVDTHWTAADNHPGHSLTVDLTYLYNLTGAQITWTQAGQAQHYIIATSQDGNRWEKVMDQGETRDRNELVSYTSFQARQVRYVRITFYGPAEDPVSVSDLQIFQAFMKGVDASTLLLMEQNGAVYYNHGVKEDFLTVLRDNGVNYVRVRLWVNPANPPQSQPGVDDLNYVAQMATRIKEMGMQFFLDFHYSDQWADPGKQFVPVAWQGESVAQLTATMQSYTQNVITVLRNQRTLPDMVQIGNEANCGILWPTGNPCTNSANWPNFAGYLNAGIAGVNAALGPNEHIRIALHYAGNYPQWWLNDMATYGVTGFDTIALSWYPMWHGTLGTLAALIPSLKAQYGKDVIVAEFAWPWTTVDHDSTPNAVDVSTISPTLLNAYPATISGQYHEVQDELSVTKDTGGLGAFYWEPGWYAVAGAGWEGGAGDGWDNMTQVDASGNPLSSLGLYKWY